MNAPAHQACLPHPLESLFVATTTMCNFHCVFCAYPKTSLKRQVMPHADFETYIQEANRFGYRSFNLTPLVGEPLTDPLFIQRLLYLESHPGVLDYYFSTNLTLADEQFLATLSGLKKLRWLSISLYGQDEESFQTLTCASPVVYRSLLARLRDLSNYTELLQHTVLKIRTTSRDYAPNPSELLGMVEQLSGQGAQVRVPGGLSNWSGMVDPKELEKLGLQTRQIDMPHTGPCVFLFKPVVLPDGRVNACSVGDGNATLVIGSLKQTGFMDLISAANPLYMALIHAHLGSHKPQVCQGCTAFRGLSEKGFSYPFHRREPINLAGMLDWLEGNAHRGISFS